MWKKSDKLQICSLHPWHETTSGTYLPMCLNEVIWYNNNCQQQQLYVIYQFIKSPNGNRTVSRRDATSAIGHILIHCVTRSSAASRQSQQHSIHSLIHSVNRWPQARWVIAITCSIWSPATAQVWRMAWASTKTYPTHTHTRVHSNQQHIKMCGI